MPGAAGAGPAIACTSPGGCQGGERAVLRFHTPDFDGIPGWPGSQKGDAAAQGPEGGPAGPELPEQVETVRGPLQEGPGIQRRPVKTVMPPGGKPGSRGSQPAGGRREVWSRHRMLGKDLTPTAGGGSMQQPARPSHQAGKASKGVKPS